MSPSEPARVDKMTELPSLTVKYYIFQGRNGTWNWGTGDGGNGKQQVEEMRALTPQLLVHWWHPVFCSWPLLCCLLCFCHRRHRRRRRQAKPEGKWGPNGRKTSPWPSCLVLYFLSIMYNPHNENLYRWMKCICFGHFLFSICLIFFHMFHRGGALIINSIPFPCRYFYPCPLTSKPNIRYVGFLSQLVQVIYTFEDLKIRTFWSKFLLSKFKSYTKFRFTRACRISNIQM